MRVKLPLEVSNLDPGSADFVNYVAQLLNALILVVNGEISFSDNFKSTIITMEFKSPNVQQVINHGLNKVPIGYLNIGSKAATQVYNGTQPSTPQLMYLQATVATTVTLLVF